MDRADAQHLLTADFGSEDACITAREHALGHALVELVERCRIEPLRTEAKRAHGHLRRCDHLGTGRAADAVRPSSAAGGRELVGTLRIGGVESVSTALLPDVLAAFAREHPHVRLEVRATRGDYLAELARANEIDLFYTLDRKLALRGFERSLIRAEDIVFAAKADVCSCQKPLEPSELARLPFVLTERGESYRSELDRALAEHDCSIEPVIEAGNTETLVHLAERGVGIAFLPRYAVENSFAARTLAPVPTTLEPVRMWVQSFRHREKWVTPAMAAFAELAERMLGKPGMQRDEGGAA